MCRGGLVVAWRLSGRVALAPAVDEEEDEQAKDYDAEYGGDDCDCNGCGFG